MLKTAGRECVGEKKGARTLLCFHRYGNDSPRLAWAFHAALSLSGAGGEPAFAAGGRCRTRLRGGCGGQAGLDNGIEGSRLGSLRYSRFGNLRYGGECEPDCGTRGRSTRNFEMWEGEKVGRWGRGGRRTEEGLKRESETAADGACRGASIL